MRTLVTGGTGFIGLHVVRCLLKAGHQVVSFSHNGQPDDAARRFVGSASVEWCDGDVLDSEQLRRIIADRRADSLVHCVAVTAIGASEAPWARRAAEVNVAGVVAVAEAARHARIERLVYVSSATVYGATDPALALDEDAASSARPRDVYAISKRAGEGLFLRCLELFDLRGHIVRLSAPYGPMETPSDSREHMSPIWSWCRAALAGNAVTLDADLQRDFTYAEDSGRGIVQALMSAESGNTFNIACGCNQEFSSILRVLHDLVPGFEFDIREGGKSDAFMLHGQRGPLSIDRAGRDLGFAPRYDLRRGLQEYLAWLRHNPY